ncbi:hypothetical protein RN001_015544 [Aquatica leii]|uniref:Uncharacterized protein n=1 Tax=Aquatica leii TaxID=1421715 RepID=A0AAN7PZG0_9COLE|nr:hypothetical protein RN001_015544 [Aquatica leii]
MYSNVVDLNICFLLLKTYICKCCTFPLLCKGFSTRVLKRVRKRRLQEDNRINQGSFELSSQKYTIRLTYLTLFI